MSVEELEDGPSVEREVKHTKPQGLVGKEALLEALFPNPADRPTVRWLDQQCKARQIPFIRLGRLIWFDVPAVRASIISRQTIPPTSSTRRRSL